MAVSARGALVRAAAPLLLLPLMLALALAPVPGCGDDGSPAGGGDGPPSADGAGGDGARGDAPAPTPDGGDVVVLPTGTISGERMVPCNAPNLPTGATCRSLTVSCPGIADAQAIVAVTEPASPAVGTVVMHAGGGGTGYLNDGFADPYLAHNLRVVQMRWSADWEQTASSGVLAAACRPATVIRWIFQNLHQGDRSRGFCGQGHSGGSGVLSYALTHYGLKDSFDFVVPSAGPPFGRIDYGCDPALYTGPPRNLCPQLTNAPIAFPPHRVDAWENTTTCGTPNPPVADQARWAADSVVSPGADFDYPQTVMSFWFCATNPNETTGLGSFYIERISSQKSVTCATQCTGEGVFNDPQAHQMMIDAMVAGCVPRHQ
ncbi:MAG TPA: hypothetical protein VKN99_12665 [Polyangia bacterium]|nr:hypothetical protein [Polyangia bacterium]